MWFVYVLCCKDSSLYTGATNNLDKRLSEHQRSLGGRYTRSHLPVRMVYSEKLPTRAEALKREVEIKSWNRGKKIKTLKLEIF